MGKFKVRRSQQPYDPQKDLRIQLPDLSLANLVRSMTHYLNYVTEQEAF